ncbi:Glycine betaine-binding protein OpuAC [Lentibacillus sp. JNUCC-1]|uniref:glycine betaine ABC transporter substrate-binding protein n=1 Tax=Lentibacillus sp. JNUCC-1 TaxID=2654513 RepID=UPI0012E8A431|nr:glycine betaine ABC transporter substrate-binding protein [Lentibacillus sp. JNUCC-1]MUV37095.1 Glycine betaine-binding protein OpuAC [Lentibacillus sp. JNUCC-1]
MKNIKKLLFTTLLGMILVLAACSGDENANDGANGNDAKPEDKAPITIGMNNWAENVAVSNMWKIILENKGYEVDLKAVEKAILYEGLSQKDVDIGMEIWMPITDKPYYEKHEDKIDLREPWYEGTDLALAVPEYMEDINSIEDLKGMEAKLDSEIIGIDPGSSIMELTGDVIEEYGLDYNLVSSSEPAMISELQKKMADEEPIVVTLWKPHWVFAEMDLKLLEDDKNIYGDQEDIHYGIRLGFEDEYPEVVEWFDNFKLNDDQLGSLMAELNEAESEEEGAQNWIDDNQDLIDEWVGETE